MNLFNIDGSLDSDVFSDVQVYLLYMHVNSSNKDEMEYALGVQGISLADWELAHDLHVESYFD